MSNFGSEQQCRIPPKSNELPALDIASLNNGIADHQTIKTLSWLQSGRVVGAATYALSSKALRLVYKSYDGRATFAHIQLTNTRPHFGGIRRWLVCPDCGRRSRILYFKLAFKCRKCVRAVYPSQYDYVRLAGEAKAKRAREMLEVAAGVDIACAAKPKRMHWKTYRKLEELIWKADNAFERYIQARL